MYCFLSFTLTLLGFSHPSPKLTLHPTLLHSSLLSVSPCSFPFFPVYSPSLFLSLSPLPIFLSSCHCAGAEDGHLGRWREQSQRSHWVVQLLLPWQLLPERCLWDQAALDGRYGSSPFRDGEWHPTFPPVMNYDHSDIAISYVPVPQSIPSHWNSIMRLEKLIL